MCPHGPSARVVSCVMVCPAAKRSREAQTSLDQLCQIDAGIARAHGLPHALLVMVREHRGEDLKAWMAEAMDSGIEALARVARGLQDDLSAITAGLTLRWSNGPVEGQVTRLKLLKRQGYGRAGDARAGPGRHRHPRPTASVGVRRELPTAGGGGTPFGLLPTLASPG
jgi:transposase